MNPQSTQIISKEVLEAISTPGFVREAVDLMRSGSFARARSLLEGGIRNQRSVVALLALAEACWDDPDPQTRDPKQSIDSLKEAIQLAPKDARPYALLGRYLLSKGLREQALNFLDRAIELDPADASSLRLRDRATLQAKKQYVVVEQGAEAMVGASASKPSPALQQRQEATRLLVVDPLKAAEALNQAESRGDTSVEAAIAGLLGADLLKADKSILQGQGLRRKTTSWLRSALVLSVVALIFLAVGAAVSFFAPPTSESPEARILAPLRLDDPLVLLRVAEQSAATDEERSITLGTVAHLWLYRYYGGGHEEWMSASDQLQSAPEVFRRWPEGLYARALLLTSQDHAAAESPREANTGGHDDDAGANTPDATLDTDIESLASDPQWANHPFLQLARAERQLHAGNQRGALPHLERAALHPEGPARASVELARAYALLGEHDLARDALERLRKRAPPYGPAALLALALRLQQELSAGEPGPLLAGEGATQATALTEETRAAALVADPEASPGATVQLRWARALALLARGADAEARSELGAPFASTDERERDFPLTRLPGLVAAYASLQILSRGDVGAATRWLKAGIEGNPDDTALHLAHARATVAAGRLRAWQEDPTMAARARFVPGGVALPLGRVEVNLAHTSLPFELRFDARRFPETALQEALTGASLSLQGALRRLAGVAQHHLAARALDAGDVAEAQKHVQAAREELGDDPAGFVLQAALELARKEKGRARDALDEALALGDDDPRILLAVAELEFSSGDPEAAQSTLQRIEDEGVVSPAARLLSALIAATGGQGAAARRQLAELRAWAPNADALDERAVDVELAMGDLEGVLVRARELAAASPEVLARRAARSATWRCVTAWLAAEQGNTERAADIAAEVTQRFPELALGHVLAGDLAAGGGDREEAERAYRRASELVRSVGNELARSRLRTEGRSASRGGKAARRGANRRKTSSSP